MRAALILLASALSLSAQVKRFEPSRFNLFSPQQDIEMGQQAADEVRKTMPVIDNKELTAYITRIGTRLAQSSRAGKFPYTYAVINDPSINAFALPGGPVFVNTGLITAVDNESELAGVLAHEMSHTTLRHGSSQVSKANLIQLPAMLAAGMLGQKQGIWASLGQLGVGLGAQSLLLRYSRDAEKQADLNGAQIMNEVGYDPQYAVELFQKLESEAGAGAKTGMFANLLSDHPAPGNRVEYVAEQNKYLPRRDYSELDPGELAKAKKIVASLPPPPKQPATAGTAAAPASSVNPADMRPTARTVLYQGNGFSLRVPGNWQAVGDPKSNTVTIAPKEALLSDSQGQTQIAYGILISHYYPEGETVNLQNETTALLKQITAGQAGMKQNGSPRKVRVAGQDSLVTSLESASPFGNQREIDMVVTAAHDDGLFYMVFIAPEGEWSAAQPHFDDVVRSLRFEK